MYLLLTCLITGIATALVLWASNKLDCEIQKGRKINPAVEAFATVVFMCLPFVVFIACLIRRA